MSKEYVERRPDGLFVTGTGVSLASVIFHFRQGASPETILQRFPAVISLENVYGAVAFFLANEPVVNAYLEEQEWKWDEFRKTSDPLPSGLPERIERVRPERP